MLPDAKGKWFSGKQLYTILDWVCKEGTTVATDDFISYGIFDRKEGEQVCLRNGQSLGCSTRCWDHA
jgi:hypothetical protein